MAIIYSYPQATPSLGDMVLGTKFIEGGGISTNSFYISDLIALAAGEIGFPTLQQVTGEGANTTVQMQINGVDVATLDDIPGTSTLQQVTTAGNATTNSVSIISSGATGLTVQGYKTGISVSNNPAWSAGIGLEAYSENGYGVYAECGEEGIAGIYASSAVKPGGGAWAASSDKRVKENIGIYSKGLEHILLVNPVTYDYNGKGGTPKSTGYIGKGGTSKSTGYIGVIAQDIKDVFPETITTYKSKLEETDKEDTDLYRFDSSALIYALINAVKELKAEIDLLKTK